MSLKRTIFIANWKMNGIPDDIKEINKVAVFLQKKLKNYNKDIIYCPPASLLAYFFKNNFSKIVKFGSQDVSITKTPLGAMTGSLSSKILKLSGAEYVIIGHSEKRVLDDTFKNIKEKIFLANKENLKIIFCIGEFLKDKKNNKSINILKKQIKSSISKNINLKNIIFAYEPVWSIGTGLVPDTEYLQKVFTFLNSFLRKNYSIKSPIILYGGSVNARNIKNLKIINYCSGYLIGGASLKAKNFIEIIKNYYN